MKITKFVSKTRLLDQIILHVLSMLMDVLLNKSLISKEFILKMQINLLEQILKKEVDYYKMDN